MCALKVLYINGGTMDMGGISAYMMNYYRHIDRKVVQIDFAVHGPGGAYDKEIESYGGKVFHLITKRKNLIENVRMLKKLIRPERYTIIHTHMDGMNALPLKIAKENGIKVRISHSHNSEHLTTSRLKYAIHEQVRRLIPRYATELWACSEKAGKWLYGQNHFTVIPNAIETEKFRFNDDVRRRLRSELGLDENYVIGYVAKLDYQKNPEFLLRVMNEIHHIASDIKLVMIGDGPAREQLHRYVAENGLEGVVIFLGQRQDVPELLNAFDVFAMPSRFEGLPVSTIEAQTNGLYCVLSDRITREVALTDNVIFLPLEDSRKWTEALANKPARKTDGFKKVIQSGYDIEQAALALKERYVALADAAR